MTHLTPTMSPVEPCLDEQLYQPVLACPLCDSSAAEVIRVETNQFFAVDAEQQAFFAPYERDPVLMKCCQACEFAYLDRLPKDPVFFENLYSAIDYDYAYEFQYHGKKQIHQDIKRQLQRHCPSGMLLDIGTWCGTLLAALSDTYTTVGCELSKPAATYGQSRGLEIRIGSFDQVGFSPNSFDIVTIIDVLEHLPQPKQVLEKIWTLLKPGGVLYIKVPNGKGQIYKQNLLQALHLSTHGVGVNFVHINHFNHRSLQTVLQTLGFEVLEMGYTKAEVWDLSYPQPFWQQIKRQFANQVKNTITALINLAASLSPWDLGFNIYVIARKPFGTTKP